MVKNSTNLHYSFNQEHSSQNRGFENELVNILRRYYKTYGKLISTSLPSTAVYKVLPNFWHGYRGHSIAPYKSSTRKTESSLSLGEAIVSKQPTSGKRKYMVQYENTTSGEKLIADFSVGSDLGNLLGNWKVKTSNSAGDIYQTATITGSVMDTNDTATTISLSMNKLNMPTIKLASRATLTVPWALPDIIPRLGSSTEYVLLEGLERLRQPAWVKPLLENWEWSDPYTDLETLTGWCAYGHGLMPTYYWIDKHGVAVIISGFFETWILSEYYEGNYKND